MTRTEARMKAGIAAACLVVAWASSASTGWAQRAGAAQSTQKPPVKQAPAKPAPPKPLSAAAAARRQPGRPGSVEVSAGAQWLAPGSLGARPATLTANSSSNPYTLFDASARMGGAPGIDARVTYNLARRLAVEGGLVYSRPQVNFTVGNDAEGAAGFTAGGDRLSQYFMDGNVLLFLPQLAFARGRGRGFVEGGAGYLRQLHQGRYNVDSGTVYNGGGGLKYYFKPRPRGFVKGFGLRVDLRAYYKRGGFSFDARNTWTPALGAAALVAF